MTERINWNLNAQIIGGPKIIASDSKEIEAYDKIDITVGAEATDIEVDIQPGGAGKVQFLLIKSEIYSKDLTYKVNSLTDSIKLDALQVFIGTGAVELLNEPPEKLVFSNGLTDPVSIEILVGRMAT